MSLDEQRITKIDSRNMQDITKRSNIHVIRIPERRVGKISEEILAEIFLYLSKGLK